MPMASGGGECGSRGESQVVRQCIRLQHRDLIVPIFCELSFRAITYTSRIVREGDGVWRLLPSCLRDHIVF